MAGGQERILRGRIRSVQATKKITRAMELIAGSRIVQGAAARARGDAVLGEDHRGRPDLAAGGRGGDSPLLAGRDEVTHHVLRRHRRRPRPVRWLQRRHPAGHRGRGQGRRRWPAGSTSIVPVGRKAEPLLPLPRLPARRALRGVHATTPTLRRRQGDRRLRRRAVHVAATSTRSSSSTPGSSRPATRRSCCARSCRSTVETVTGGDGRPAPRRRATPGDYEFEPDPATMLDALLPSYIEARIYAALLNAAASRARRHAAGDEGGDRQRRRADQDAQPHHEPRPPGLDHHRDHGDRQRRRGARRRRGVHHLPPSATSTHLRPLAPRALR